MKKVKAGLWVVHALVRQLGRYYVFFAIYINYGVDVVLVVRVAQLRCHSLRNQARPNAFVWDFARVKLVWVSIWKRLNWFCACHRAIYYTLYFNTGCRCPWARPMPAKTMRCNIASSYTMLKCRWLSVLYKSDIVAL